MIIIGKSSGMPLGTIKKLRNLLRSPKDYIRLQGGRGDTQKITLYYKGGSIWFNQSIKENPDFTDENQFFELNFIPKIYLLRRYNKILITIYKW